MFPQLSIDRFFTNSDVVWSANVSETSTDIDRRARNVLDRLFEAPGHENIQCTFLLVTFSGRYILELNRGILV